MPAPTMENSIQGKMPGAVIQSNNGGAPGGGMQIQVRGVTSINGNASPLYVVDGVIVDNETVNADDNAINQDRRRHDVDGSGRDRRAKHAGQRRQPHRRHQPGRHREHRGPEGRVGVGDLRIQGVGRRGHHHDEEGHERQAQVGLSASRSATSRIENTVPDPHVPDAWPAPRSGTSTTSRRQTPGASGCRGQRVHQAVYAGPQDYQTAALRQQPAVVSDEHQRERDVGPDAVLPVGAVQVRQRPDDNTGYNKQSVRSNVTENVQLRAVRDGQPELHPRLTRRGITGNDNIGISPYNVLLVSRRSS